MKLLRRALLVLVPLALLGGAAVYWLAFTPNTQDYEGTRGVFLPPDVTFEQALDSLEAAGIVASRSRLELAGDLSTWGDQVKWGHYLIPAGATNRDILSKLRRRLVDPVQVTIPPGTRPEVVAAVLRRDLPGVDSAEVVAALRDPELAAELGTDTTHLFGRMRANSFEVHWTTDAHEAVRRVHEWYDRFWTDERRAQAEALGLSPDEVVTLASIVEWEARQPAERPRIAGVYLNRLLGRTSAGTMRLQADPTVQYALMQIEGPPMRRLFFRDYALDHPYNTYQIDGLPPGPITNPSESSIDAVLAPEDHEYLFFVADGSGGHRFARTAAEHGRNAREWSRWLSEQVRIGQARRDSLRRDSLARASQPAPAEPTTN